MPGIVVKSKGKEMGRRHTHFAPFHPADHRLAFKGRDKEEYDVCVQVDLKVLTDTLSVRGSPNGYLLASHDDNVPVPTEAFMGSHS